MAGFRFLLPSLMCGGLLLGTLVAITHHLFYQSLNGKIVHSDDQQQWSLRIGTGLAFLAKTFLTSSAALAYTQLLWHTLRSSPFSLHGVDSLFGAVSNAWHFTDWELWRRGPALAIVALIVWMLPIIAIVTPATLTVHPAAKPNQTVHHLSIPSINYGIEEDQVFAFFGSDGIPSYRGPTPRIVRLLSSVMSQGSILQIAAPYPNCTYSVPFYGPSLSCGPTTTIGTGNSSFQEDIWDLINQYSPEVTYASFVPQQPTQKLNITWFTYAALDGLQMLLTDATNTQSLPSSDGTTIDSVNTDHARLYATFLKHGANESDGPSTFETIECGLYNTSYVVNFTFENGQQEIIVTNMTQLNGVSSLIYYFYPYGPMMAYWSIMDALGNIVTGLLAFSTGDIFLDTTQIASTLLMESTDLQGSLPNGSAVTAFREQSPIVNMTLSKALEQIVLNTTLSLFSNSHFLQNLTTASILSVLVSTPQNAYVYNSKNLFIAYGLGILIATLVVIVGIICIWASGNSFGASFSAILRTTRNVQLDAIVPAKETHGAFPMSKELGKTKLILCRQRGMRTAFRVVEDDGADGEEMDTTKSSATSRRMSFDSLLHKGDAISQHQAIF